MDLGSLKPAGAASGDGDIVKSATTASFGRDVIEASRTTLVLVDFWAPWCGPCKQLTPILEKVVRSYGGKVRLVKINIDEHPAIAGQLRVQSIPTVYAFRDGRPLDGFLGAQPESAVRQIIERLLGPEDSGEGDIEAVLKSGDEALESGDLPGAAEVYTAVLEIENQNVRALIGLAKVYMAGSDLRRAEATLDLVPADKRAAAYDSARAALELAKKAGTADNRVALETRLIANPGDHQARFDLAVALAARGDKGQAADHLLEIMRRERAWNDEAARKQLLQFFDAWGHMDPATTDARRKLSSLLFR